MNDQPLADDFFGIQRFLLFIFGYNSSIIMKKINTLITAVCILTTAFVSSCGGSKNENNPNSTDSTAAAPEIKAETVTYTDDSVTLKGFVAYDAAGKEKMPLILIVPEWWGVNDYVKGRAKQLADLGYFAMVVDMYGEGKLADNPDDAQKLAMPFYMDPYMSNARIEAAWEKARSFGQADTQNTIAIGYCFGGSMVLTAAKMGFPFKGVVSFHGGLAGMRPEKDRIKAEILVCHGAADKFVSPEEVTRFKTQMDSVGAKYTFKEYADATHAFTNPDATANGKKFNLPIAYNEKADKDSWNDFMAFLDKVLKK
jgi:dienelactone hydrolase